jgi:DNA polymerase I
MGKLLALDGNSLTYRAFFALPPDMTTASGQVTNAVFGFTSMLINLLKDHRPDALVVAFDRPEKTFRHEANPQYKANREAAPDILRQQMGLVREVLDALGVTTLDAAGWEADDLLGTIATQISESGHDVIIVSGDRDTYQLVSDPHVSVLYNKRGVSDYALYDEAGIVERTGVAAAQYVDYAAMRGDTSDNLPGIPGVGEKTAAKLISTYGTLEAALDAADAQTPKLKAALIEHRDVALANKMMMTVRRDAPITVAIDELTIKPDADAVRRVFEFLEFASLLTRLKAVLAIDGETGDDSPTVAVLEAEVDRLETIDEVVAFLAGNASIDAAATYFATPGRSAIEGLAVVRDAATADVVWIAGHLLAEQPVLDALVRHPLRTHDAKSLFRSLLPMGADWKLLTLDIAIAAYLLDPAAPSYALDVQLERHTPWTMPSATPAGQLDLGGGVDSAVDAARHALAVATLAPVLLAQLADTGMDALSAEIEVPLVRVLARMEVLGIGVDEAALRALNTHLTNEVERLSGLIYQDAGKTFNINSTPQLRAVLFDELGLATGKKTKTGYSTDAQSLEKLLGTHPIIEHLMTYREMEKLRSTYGTGLLAEVAPDGRIHATFNQTVARTGRLSSDQPNLHNIPVRSEQGRVFRTAFVPRSGCELLVADYNQIELRCIAHLSNDPGLVEAFNSGIDIHNATAARIFGVEPSAVTVEQRSKSKMVSYGLAYGMESFGLAQRLNIKVSEASEILNAYFAAFPSVRAYMDQVVAESRNKGYTETLFGRRRPIPELLSDNPRVRQAGERQAMNAGIQGLAADIFKVALIRLDEALEGGGYESRITLQVHDEVVCEVPASEMDDLRELVPAVMASAADLCVPLLVNLSVGSTWAAAKG